MYMCVLICTHTRGLVKHVHTVAVWLLSKKTAGTFGANVRTPCVDTRAIGPAGIYAQLALIIVGACV